jgi:hypothetical protein
MQSRLQAGRETLKLNKYTGGLKEEEGGYIQTCTLSLSPTAIQARQFTLFI